MIIEEAIERLGSRMQFLTPVDDLDALEMEIDALRTQQTPEKLDRSRWEGCDTCKESGCDVCEYSTVIDSEYPCAFCFDGSHFETKKFCPDCGKPLTEEAWAELERRIGGPYEQTG